MKFAKINASQKRENFGIKGVFLKFPDFILDWYILHYHSFNITPFQLANAEGYSILIYEPFKEKQKHKQKKTVENLLSLLTQKEVGILLLEKEILLPHSIPIATGKTINALFVMDAVKKALQRQTTTLQKSHFLLIDGGNFITKLVLDMIYPYINYLSIYTDRQEDFSQKSEEIYEEYGLRIQLFSSIKNKIVEECNIILNCGYDMQKLDYRLQKNAFYFDIVQNKEKLRRLRQRRNDLLFCDGLIIKWENKTYSSKEIEAILCTSKTNIQHFLYHNGQKEATIEALHFIQQNKMFVTGFSCFEKRV